VGDAVAAVGPQPSDRCAGVAGVVAEEHLVGVGLRDLGGLHQGVDLDLDGVELDRERCRQPVCEAAGDDLQLVGRPVGGIVECGYINRHAEPQAVGILFF